MTTWLIRSTKQKVEKGSPAKVAARLGVPASDYLGTVDNPDAPILDGEGIPTGEFEQVPNPTDASFVDSYGLARSNTYAIWKPDLSAVDGFDSKYWIVGAYPDDSVTLMDQAARDALDAQEEADRVEGIATQLDRTDDILRAFMLLCLDQFNDLRADHGRNPFTVAQLRNAIKNKIGD